MFITLVCTKLVFFIAVAHVLLFLWQLKVFIIMGKVKIGIYCYFIADILTKVFQKCLLNGPLPNYFGSDVSIKLVVIATKRLNLREKLLRSYIVGKAETLQPCS